jgi:hypothetical protein
MKSVPFPSILPTYTQDESWRDLSPYKWPWLKCRSNHCHQLRVYFHFLYLTRCTQHGSNIMEHLKFYFIHCRGFVPNHHVSLGNTHTARSPCPFHPWRPKPQSAQIPQNNWVLFPNPTIWILTPLAINYNHMDESHLELRAITHHGRRSRGHEFPPIKLQGIKNSTFQIFHIRGHNPKVVII